MEKKQWNPDDFIFNMKLGDFIDLLRDQFPMLSVKPKTDEDEGPTFSGRLLFSPKEVESFFRISHKCASKWLQPTGWLYPAIKKNGRKIILDLDYALKLKAKRDQTANPEEGGQSHE